MRIALPRNATRELTAASGYSTGINFSPTAADIMDTYGIAIDSAANIWVSNTAYSVSELLASGGYSTANTFSAEGAAFDDPASIALDSSGNLWLSNIFPGTSGSVSDCLEQLSGRTELCANRRRV